MQCLLGSRELEAYPSMTTISLILVCVLKEMAETVKAYIDPRKNRKERKRSGATLP